MPSEAEDAAIVWRCREAIREAEAEMEAAERRLKERTGDRDAGNFFVSVTSSNQESVDTVKCRAMLGDKTPMRLSARVVLRVKPTLKAVGA